MAGRSEVGQFFPAIFCEKLIGRVFWSSFLGFGKNLTHNKGVTGVFKKLNTCKYD
jgi:hypothetical protein